MSHLLQKWPKNFITKKLARWIHQTHNRFFSCILLGGSTHEINSSYLRKIGVSITTNPRQADILVLSLPLTEKMGRWSRILYDQMPFPKYTIGIGNNSQKGFPEKAYSFCSLEDVGISLNLHVPDALMNTKTLMMAFQQLRNTLSQDITRGEEGEESADKTHF